MALSVSTRIPFHVLAEYDDHTIATYIDVLNELNEKSR